MVLVNSPFISNLNTRLNASPLDVSNWFLNLCGVDISVRGQERLPHDKPLVLVSNHRSFMDAPLLMHVAGRPVRFACHHYMGQVPGLREIVSALGGMPLDAPESGQTAFFRRALNALKDHEAIGIFPEGAAPMVQKTNPNNLNKFHRGFAHLAMRAPVNEVTVVPVAISSQKETNNSVMPLRLLSLIDPSEPLFQQPGWHPAVAYQKVELRIGHPVRIDDRFRHYYRDKGVGKLITELTECCQNEVAALLKQG
jgi:1-acyl-sn-glycerol-3-phosphate acyltransferase